MRIVRKFQRAFRRTGLLGTVRLVFVNVARLPGELLRKPSRTWFDEQYGVDTDRWAPLSEFNINSPNDVYGQEYAPITVQLFQDAVGSLNIAHERFTFIDLGSGKGRALLLAAAYPFRKIIGVEFVPELHQIAVENLRVYNGPVVCRNIEPVCMDATKFEFPRDPLVILLFNPFIGPTMIEVLSRIEDSLRRCPREIYILYATPLLAAEFRRSRLLREIQTHEHYCIFYNQETVTATTSD